MGKAISSIGSALGIGPQRATPTLERGAFDIAPQAKKYEELLAGQREFTAGQNRALSEALAQQARGEGPLAGAAMRQAANRSLAQTLSAAQAMGGSPLAARNIIQARGQSARDLAELRLKEQQEAQQMLGQQLSRAAETGRSDITTGFGIAKSPQEMMADYAKAKYAGEMGLEAQQRKQESDILGNVLGAAGKAATAYFLPATAATAILGKQSAHGEIVPGVAAKEDSKANDTEPRLVSPGEMVVPASVVQAGSKAVEKFADALLKQQQRQKDAPLGYGDIVALRKRQRGK